MNDSTKRKVIVWLLPIAILLLIFGPAVVQTFSNSSKGNEVSKVENTISSEQSKPEPEEKPVQESDPKSKEKEEPERLKEPVLELTTRKIVELKKGESIDYQSYIQTATDSKGKDMKSEVEWTKVDNSYTETAQGVNFKFTDKETGEVVSDILLVKFLEK